MHSDHSEFATNPVQSWRLSARIGNIHRKSETSNASRGP